MVFFSKVSLTAYQEGLRIVHKCFKEMLQTLNDVKDIIVDIINEFHGKND